MVVSVGEEAKRFWFGLVWFEARKNYRLFVIRQRGIIQKRKRKE